VITAPQPRGNTSPSGHSYNRRALVHRWVFFVLLLVVALLGFTGTALAAARVSLDPAADGTLILVGSGWRPGQQLAVSVGRDVYPAMADSAGSFEVRTGLPVTSGPPAPIAVHREDTSALALAALAIASPREEPHPFAVLFAQGLATGATWLAVSAGGIGAIALTSRAVQARRRERG
jgi:hypothetical protein